MKRLNKKGFTLVELLAVIVILALIMAIAIYSISGILQSSRENVFKETALNVINGIKMQLTASNELREGTYYFSEKLLENNNDLPFGGKIDYGYDKGAAIDASRGTVSRATAPVNISTCVASNGVFDSNLKSFVNVGYNGSQYTFEICLIPTKMNGSTSYSGTQKYIRGSETELLGNSIATIKDIIARTS